jgi:putative salt-induced outer membrane protein YdiY
MKNILLGTILTVSTASAIVSIKPIEVSGQEEVKSQLGASYSTKSGNSDVSTTSISLKNTFYNIDSANMILIDYEYGKSNGSTNTDNTFMHLRHIRTTSDKAINYEIFLQAQKDTFRSIESRYLMGIGSRYKVHLENDSKIFFGLGVFSTKLDEDNVKSNFESLNSYISYNHKLDNGNTLTYNGYFQPRLDDANDYHISQKAQLSFDISRSMKLVVSLNHTYDSEPAVGINKSDLSTKTGISYKF